MGAERPLFFGQVDMPRGRVALSKEAKLRVIEENSVPEPNTGCRIWLGPLGTTGYATGLQVGHVARWLCTEINGDCLLGKSLYHSCGHSWCCEPRHVYAGPHKRKPVPLPPSSELLDLFKYDPLTGVLLWRSGRHAGKSAGTIGTGGCIMVRVGGVAYKAHRVIWKMTTGSDPARLVDHRDRDPGNNRWLNLREADYVLNAQNRLQPRQSQYPKGVHKRITRRGVVEWIVVVKTRGKRVRYYTGQDYDAACHIAREKFKELHGEFYCVQP